MFLVCRIIEFTMFPQKMNNFSFDSDAVNPSLQDSMTLDLLYSAVMESACDDRLVLGLSDCIELLRMNPTTVMVCLLPEDDGWDRNMNLSIQLILIESICHEYEIPIVKVNKNQIKKALSSELTDCLYQTKPSKKAFAFISELDCCFIKGKNKELSSSEKKLMEMIHNVQDGNYGHTYPGVS